MSNIIVCGTGHRPNKLGGYTAEVTNKLVELATIYLERVKPAQVITGMALGWDQAIGWAAYDLKIPFIAAVPFEWQEKMWPPNTQQWYNDLLKLAHRVEHVCGPGYAPWKMQKRNEWMVDNSDRVVALWDGSAGGTGNCINYAEKVGKPIDNLWERYSELSRTTK